MPLFLLHQLTSVLMKSSPNAISIVEIVSMPISGRQPKRSKPFTRGKKKVKVPNVASNGHQTRAL